MFAREERYGQGMRPSRLQIKNFRNLPAIDIPLGPDVIVVGENRSGKSNLVTAVRLVLDQSLSSADRRLTADDFWDGLGKGAVDYDPMEAGDSIEVSIDFVEFGDNDYLLALLGEGLVSTEPLTARLTYRWGPVEDGSPDYRGAVYLGDSTDRRMPPDLRDRLLFAYLHALRDVETDMRSWRRSPLRSLLEAAASAAAPKALQSLEKAVRETQDRVNDLTPIADLARDISDRTEQIVGARQALATTLAGTPQDAMRMIRALHLYVDGDAARPLSATSLGAQNVLYLALLQLGMEAQIEESLVEHVFLGIEEPEAHLHPHLQRSLLDNLTEQRPSRSLLITTHSPHIASAASPKSLVRLHAGPEGTVAYSASSARLTSNQWKDIGRYLDATRSEMVFAARVLLVEGFAEQTLIPRLAQSRGTSFDKEGVTVCAVHGTHFGSYVKFCDALGIPWAVVTDGDPVPRKGLAGSRRAKALVNALGRDPADPAGSGVFVGEDTFETDLLHAGANQGAIAAALLDMASSRTSLSKKVKAWQTAGASDTTLYMSLIDRLGGKGRFAQRLVADDLDMPAYVNSAVEYLLAR
jgi:putative ATP-dependent endonuclease of the OLD family